MADQQPTFADVLRSLLSDTPAKTLGNVIDFGYDNTIGNLTNTRDMFTGEDLRIPLSFMIPGLGGMELVSSGLGLLGEKLGLKPIDSAFAAKDDGKKMTKELVKMQPNAQGGAKNG